MREPVEFDPDDALGVPCGIINARVEPTHQVAREWEQKWKTDDLDPLVAAWQESLMDAAERRRNGGQGDRDDDAGSHRVR